MLPTRARLGAAASVRAWALPAIVSAFIVRLAAVVQPIGIDQGIFMTAGWGLTEGLRLYRDLWDQKPPGVHLAYAFAHALVGHRATIPLWLDLAAGLVTCVALFGVVRAAGGRRVAWVAATVYAVGTIPAARYGYGGFLERAVPEVFICALASTAAWAVIAATRGDGARRTAWLSLSGILLGAALIFKPNAALLAAPMAAWIAMGRSGRRARDLALVAGAALVVPAALVGWLLAQGIAADAWVAVVEYNRRYIALGPGPISIVDRGVHEGWRYVKTDPLWTIAAVAGVWAIGRWWSTRRLPRLAALAVVWLAATVIGAMANGIRMYSTYFIPALPALAMLASTLFEFERPRRRDIAVIALALLLAGTVAVSRGHIRRLADTTAADVREFFTAPANTTSYLERFGRYNQRSGYSARANRELVGYLQSHAAKGDRAFIWGMAPAVYFDSRLLPAQRFLWVYPGVANLVSAPGFGLPAVLADLSASQPAFLVLEANNRDSLTGWRVEDDFSRPEFLATLSRYELATRIEDFTVYRLARQAPPR